MNDKLKNAMEFLSLPWKLIIIIGILVSLFVGMFTIDNRFAKSDQLIAMAADINEDTTNKILLVEAQSVKTFQGLQMQQMIIQRTTLIQMYQMHKEFLERENSRLRREVKIYPNDQGLKNQLDYNNQQMIKLQEQIDKNLSGK